MKTGPKTIVYVALLDWELTINSALPYPQKLSETSTMSISDKKIKNRKTLKMTRFLENQDSKRSIRFRRRESVGQIQQSSIFIAKILKLCKDQLIRVETWFFLIQ